MNSTRETNSDDILRQRQRIAERIPGSDHPIRWTSPKAGTTTCPLNHSCEVFVDDNPVPYFHCFHERCKSELAEWNRQLRDACQRSGHGVKSKPTKEEKERISFQKRLATISRNTGLFVLPKLIAQPGIAEDDWVQRSPYPLPQDCRDDWKILLSGLFKPDDILWMGWLEDTGAELHTVCFKPLKEWLNKSRCPGPQVCPAAFYSYERGQAVKEASEGFDDEAEGDEGDDLDSEYCPERPLVAKVQHILSTHSRRHENVRIRPYMVIESDTVKMEQFGNVVVYLEQHFTLRAIVHTGGKSMHCWFDHPPYTNRMFHDRRCDHSGRLSDKNPTWQSYQGKQMEKFHRQALLAWEMDKREKTLERRKWDEFLAMLEGLGCDLHMLGLNSTTRLPGFQRTDEETGNVMGWQRLLWFNPKYPPLI